MLPCPACAEQLAVLVLIPQAVTGNSCSWRPLSDLLTCNSWVPSHLKGVGGADGGELLAVGGCLADLLLPIVHVVDGEHHLHISCRTTTIATNGLLVQRCWQFGHGRQHLHREAARLCCITYISCAACVATLVVRSGCMHWVTHNCSRSDTGLLVRAQGAVLFSNETMFAGLQPVCTKFQLCSSTPQGTYWNAPWVCTGHMAGSPPRRTSPRGLCSSRGSAGCPAACPSSAGTPELPCRRSQSAPEGGDRNT